MARFDMKTFIHFIVFVLTIDYQRRSHCCATYAIGAIFDRNAQDIITAFKYESKYLKEQKDPLDFEVFAKYDLDATDSFAVSNEICLLLQKGVYGILGVSNTSALSTIQSYSNTFRVPILALSMPQNGTNNGPFQLFMRPLYIDGLLHIILKYQWSNILYLYDSDEGLIRLQQLFQALNQREFALDIDVKRVTDPLDCQTILKEIHVREDTKEIRVFLDLPMKRAEETILLVKNDSKIKIHKFHFLLGELGIEEMNMQNFMTGGVNVTGFQLVNMTSTIAQKYLKTRQFYDKVEPKMRFEEALVIDALRFFYRALRDLTKNVRRQNLPERIIKCTDDSNVSPHNGSDMMEILKKTDIEGLTGRVAFDEYGFRKDFTLQLMEITMNMGLATVGRWTPGKELERHEAKRKPIFDAGITLSNRTRMVTTILERPYVMYKDAETQKRNPRCGKDNFIGFCVDFAREVARIVNFTYEICLVKDGRYGEMLTNATWNGMVGELTRNEVDMAIAPISISSQRERVVDFTKPYMSLGISIMIKKTAVKETSVFSFMDPLSYEIWMCILFAYIGVSVVLFLVSRFSPTEWHVEDGASITNDFTIANSLWYSLGAFMQQGCDISPRSVSGRIVGSVWWFFTLIIISSYTANLAAFLTVERMLTPIESAEDLAKQTEIQYGTVESGSTKNFFKQSKVALYERMWAYMQSASPSVFVTTNEDGVKQVRKGNYAFLIESTTNDYINMRKPCDTMKVGANLDSKGYGIATPIGSDLRDQLTLAVLQLRESGTLENMKKEWWDKKSECPLEDSSQDGGQTELTLGNVAGIFYILVAGLILSVIIAFCEFIYKSKVDSAKSKTSFGSVLRNKARLSFRGSLDRDTPGASTPLRKSMSTYTYTGPPQIVGADGFTESNTHTQV
ncbi:hypothetical protein CHS0354_023655 [Potamilus streckersoni]|uniref:Glutamate receptor n=1 Tax=Potamilus streckersoni TaxID=2493646 RepID=A0AAE0SMH8_9BIVA|nr:hypothetical protein CHS0354_023655 [Potamilus streckersoni]